jgi:hypothetical protein
MYICMYGASEGLSLEGRQAGRAGRVGTRASYSVQCQRMSEKGHGRNR